MLVSDVLKSKGSGVITVSPDETVWAVVRKFRLHHIGALVVTDADDELLGLFTERDLVMGLLAYGKQVLDRPVREAMSTGVPTCRPGDTVATVMQTMTGRRVRHLPVIAQGALQGIISIGDLVKARLDDLELENRVLRDIARSHH